MSNESGYDRYTLDDAEDHIVRLQTEIAELKEELRVGNHLLAVATDRQRDLETENATLKEAQRAVKRAVSGVYCFKAIAVSSDLTTAEVYEEMKTHDRQCSANPLVAENATLKEENKRQRGRITALSLKEGHMRVADVFEELKAENAKLMEEVQHLWTM